MSERITFIVFVLLFLAIGYIGFTALKQSFQQSNQVQDIRVENAERQMEVE